MKGNGKFDVKIRVPRWAKRGFFVKINGRDEKVKAAPGTYLTLARTWQDNDTIELRMPFSFDLNTVVDQPNVASVFYGPVLLAAEESGPRTDWRPVTLDARDLAKSFTGDPATLRFTHRRRRVQAVLRIVRTLLGVPARLAEIAMAHRLTAARSPASSRRGRRRSGARHNRSPRLVSLRSSTCEPRASEASASR